MNVSLDVCSKSLNKREEELCGDTVEIVKTADADIIILSDGMGSGVKANILSTLTTRILGTMLKNGETIEDCVETIAMTLPICKNFARVQCSAGGLFHICDPSDFQRWACLSGGV